MRLSISILLFCVVVGSSLGWLLTLLPAPAESLPAEEPLQGREEKAANPAPRQVAPVQKRKKGKELLSGISEVQVQYLKAAEREDVSAMNTLLKRREVVEHAQHLLQECVAGGAETGALKLLELGVKPYGHLAMLAVVKRLDRLAVQLIMITNGGEKKERKELFVKAAARGMKQTVSALLALGVDVDALSEVNSCTALCSAAENGQTDIVKLLLQSGAGNKSRQEALLAATINRHEACIDLLLSANIAPCDLSDVLEIAVMQDATALAERILAAGAQLSEADTPLTLALKYGKSGVVQALVEKRLYLDDCPPKGEPPLIVAIHKGNAEMVEKLLQAGARAGLRDESGKSPALDMAENQCRWEHGETVSRRIVDLLLAQDKTLKYDSVKSAILEDDADATLQMLREGKEWDVKDNTPLTMAITNRCEKVCRALIEQKMYLNVAGKEGNPPLVLAIRYGNLPLLQQLLQAGADTTCCVEKGITLAEYIDRKGDSELNGFLAEHCPKLVPRPRWRPVDLINAALQHDLPTAKQIVQDGFYPERTKVTDFPMYEIVRQGDAEAVKILLDVGADVNGRDRWDHTPLSCAIEENKVDIVRVLLDAGADLNAEVKAQTPLMQAMKRTTSPEIVSLLLAHGADVEAETPDGMSVMAYAIRYGSTESIRVLVKAGVNPSGMLQNKLPYLFYALGKRLHQSKRRHGPDISVDHFYKAVPVLLECGADAAATYNGESALEAYLGSLAMYYSPKLVPLFLKQGANVNVRNKKGQTLLMIAIRNMQPNAKKLTPVVDLLASGVDVNAADNEGRTALMYAAMRGRFDTVKLLLAAGARKDALDKENKSAADFTISQELFDLLQ